MILGSALGTFVFLWFYLDKNETPAIADYPAIIGIEQDVKLNWKIIEYKKFALVNELLTQESAEAVCQTKNSSLPLPRSKKDFWLLRKFMTSSGNKNIKNGHPIPTRAFLTKNGKIVEKSGRFLDTDIYPNVSEEFYLPKTVALLDFFPKSKKIRKRICLFNLIKNNREPGFAKFFIVF